MVPGNDNNGQYLIETEYPSRTYRLDFKNKRVGGFIDGFDAVIQDIYKKINTERYSKIIYDDYGTEIEVLQGQDSDYVKTVLESKLTDALLSDNRVTSITDFTIISAVGDELVISFVVETIYGTKLIGPIGI